MNESENQLIEEWFSLSEEELFTVLMMDESTEEQMENAIIVLEVQYGYTHDEILEVAPLVAAAGRAAAGAGRSIVSGVKKTAGAVKSAATTADTLGRNIPLVGGVVGAGIDTAKNAYNIMGNNLNPFKKDYVVRSLDDFLPGMERPEDKKKKENDHEEQEKNRPLGFINKNLNPNQKKNESFDILSDISLFSVLQNENETYENRINSSLILESRGYDLNEYSLNQFKSDASDTARGVAKGLTFGASDNIEAGAKSLLKGTSYKNELSKARSANAAAEKRSPKLFGGGEIAGSIGSTFAIPGGAAVRGLSAAAKLGKVGRGVASIAHQSIGSSAIQSGVDKLKPRLEPKSNISTVKSQIKKSLPTVKPIKTVNTSLKPISRKYYRGKNVKNFYTI